MRFPAGRARRRWITTGDFRRVDEDKWVASSRWPLAAVNAWDDQTLVDRLGGLYEDSPWIVAAAAAARPFASFQAFHDATVAVIAAAPEERRLALIRAHPDLVGRAALAGTLTRASAGEQRAAGLDPGRLTAEEIDRFRSLNQAYSARFGFPFVIRARDHTKSSILAAFERRLTNGRDQEIAVALDEIARIGWHRLGDLVEP